MRWTFERETAAAEVEHAAFCCSCPDAIRQRVETPPACLFDLKEARLAEDPEMFGHVVLRDTHARGNLADVERCVDQQTDDADPGVLAKRPERDDAVVAMMQ